ncbi:MAG: ribosome biogenesis GTPase Der [Patescibacteria group bacterium]
MKKVGLIGLTNVGKSTLFNRLVGEKRAVVSDIAGTTRDFLTGIVKLKKSKQIELLDFAGFDFTASGLIEKKAQLVVRDWIKKCDIIIFIVDGRKPLSPDDLLLRSLVMKIKKPTITVVNKVEDDKVEMDSGDFYKLGGQLLFISALNNRGVQKLLERIDELAFEEDGVKMDQEILAKIVFLGRPNAGKSSIFNALCGYERSIVSDIPGTTRDQIDTIINMNGSSFLVIDTAGLRRRAKTHEELDVLSTKKSLSAIKDADIVIVVLDAGVGLVAQDITLIDQAFSNGKRVIVVVNKWDLVSREYTQTQYASMLRIDNALFKKVPIFFTSVPRSKGIADLAEFIRENYISSMTIPTARLNRVIEKVNATLPSTRGKIYYATQTSKSPLEFVLFVNKKDHFNRSGLMAIENSIRETFNLIGLMIRLIIREKEKR